MFFYKNTNKRGLGLDEQRNYTRRCDSYFWPFDRFFVVPKRPERGQSKRPVWIEPYQGVLTEYLWWMGKHSRRKPKCRGRRSKLFQGRPESYEDVNVKWNCLSSHGLQCEPGFFALSKWPYRSAGKCAVRIYAYSLFVTDEAVRSKRFRPYCRNGIWIYRIRFRGVKSHP